jgi:hypothetical protein
MKRIVLVILFLAFVLTGCSIGKTQEPNSQKQPLQSKQVVENYYKYYNEKNKEGVISTLTDQTNTKYVLDENIKYIKLNNIVEDVRPSPKEAYMKYGRGLITGAKEENIIIYKVEYTVKYKKDRVAPQDSGKCTTWFTLIRKDKNSFWLIDDMGEG